MAELSVKLSNRFANQSGNPSTTLTLRLVSILEATHREAVRSVVVEHGGIAAAEAEVARVSATNRTAPIVAEGTDIGERTIAAVAVARHGQFKRGGKSPHRCSCTPT